MSRGLAWTAAFLFHAIAGAAAAAPEHRAAVRSVTASAPARGQSIEVTVWYPTDAKGGSVANLLFQSFSYWGEGLSGGGIGVQGQAF